MARYRWRGTSPGPVSVFREARQLLASKRRTVGRGITRAPNALGSTGAGSATSPASVFGRRYCRWLWNELNALKEPRPRGMQRESAASPLPRLRVLPRTSCASPYCFVWHSSSGWRNAPSVQQEITLILIKASIWVSACSLPICFEWILQSNHFGSCPVRLLQNQVLK
jgi:hypothetical protein